MAADEPPGLHGTLPSAEPPCTGVSAACMQMHKLSEDPQLTLHGQLLISPVLEVWQSWEAGGVRSMHAITT